MALFGEAIAANCFLRISGEVMKTARHLFPSLRPLSLRISKYAFLLFQYILTDFDGFNLFIRIKVLFSQTESGGL